MGQGENDLEKEE